MQNLVDKATFEVTVLIIFVMDDKWNKRWRKFNQTNSFCEACLEACLEMREALIFLEDRKQLPQTLMGIKELQRIIKRMIDEVMSKAWGCSRTEERRLIQAYARGNVLAELYLKYKRMELGYNNNNDIITI